MNLTDRYREANAWKCICEEVNLLRHSHCYVCNTPKEAPGCKYIYRERSLLSHLEDRLEPFFRPAGSRPSRFKDAAVLGAMVGAGALAISGTSVSEAMLADLSILLLT